MASLDVILMLIAFGTVVATYVENFEDVRAKQAVLRLLDTKKIEMVINVPENLMPNLKYVKSIAVTFDAFPKHTLPATIKEVGTEASRYATTSKSRGVISYTKKCL